MLIAALTLMLTTAAAPPTGFTSSVERVALVKNGQPLTLNADALRARLVVRGATLPPNSAHAMCPNVETKQGELIFTCNTRHVWAALVEDKAGLYLDLRQLRGVVPSDESLLLRPWPLAAISLPGECPGTQPGPRAECALAAGDVALAKKTFEEAIGGADTNLARLRLGDMALIELDLETALASYSKVSVSGPIGRMAKVRACDLTFACLDTLDSKDVSDSVALPEPLKTEFELYELRRLLVSDRVDEAMSKMSRRMTMSPSLCEGVASLCQHLVLAGLEAEAESTRLAALSVYLHDEIRYGLLQRELALAASQVARGLGAPAFAAALLSSISPGTSPSKLDAHLLNVAQLFLEANDRLRADYIVEYADGRLGHRSSRAWQAVRRQAQVARANRTGPMRWSGEFKKKKAVDVAQLTDAVEVSAELARAATLRARARD